MIHITNYARVAKKKTRERENKFFIYSQYVACMHYYYYRYYNNTIAIWS